MKNDKYEDEIDRMRARRAAKKDAKGAASASACLRDEPELTVVDPFADEEIDSRKPERPTAGRTLSEEVNRELKRRKRKKKTGLRLLTAAVLIVCAFGFFRFTGGGYWTVAVYGVDSRDGNLGRGALSDVEMLCSINRRSGEIRLLSVFRDSYLRISDDRYDKINEAYFLGGHSQATEALESNLDVKVDDYATFNWKAVADAINVLGGVDLEITDKEFAFINSFITETVESTGVPSVHLEHSGMNHLDGVQSVAYARLRLMDTDFNRTERQRKVLGLVMEKVKQADAGTLTTLAGTVFPQISTSIGLDDILKLAKNPKKYYIGVTSGFPFSHQEMNVGKKSCVIPTTLESNVVQLHAFLYDDSAYTASDTVKEISAQIARETGLGEPGRDTESGRNVGAQGSSSEAGAAQTAAAAAETAEKSDDHNETKPETDSAQTQAAGTENSAEETGTETEIPEDTKASFTEEFTTEEYPGESVGAAQESSDSGFQKPVTIPSVNSSGPASAPGSDGPSSDQSGSASSGGPGSASQTPNTSLEAPGEHGADAAVSGGPGVNQ